MIKVRVINNINNEALFQKKMQVFLNKLKNNGEKIISVNITLDKNRFNNTIYTCYAITEIEDKTEVN